MSTCRAQLGGGAATSRRSDDQPYSTNRSRPTLCSMVRTGWLAWLTTTRTSARRAAETVSNCAGAADVIDSGHVDLQNRGVRAQRLLHVAGVALGVDGVDLAVEADTHPSPAGDRSGGLCGAQLGQIPVRARRSAAAAAIRSTIFSQTGSGHAPTPVATAATSSQAPVVGRRPLRHLMPHRPVRAGSCRGYRPGRRHGSPHRTAVGRCGRAA